MTRLLLLFSLLISAFLPATSRATDGYRVFVCGHSFHLFIDQPLQALALEAGHADHRIAGKQTLGNSTCQQIWNLPDAPTDAKHALTAGNVDVLTLSPHAAIPDPGIDLFANLAAQHSPTIRVFLQVSWSPKMVQNPDSAFWRLRSVEYMDVLRGQARALNKQHQRDYVFLVPVGPAVLTLWEQITAGKVPGVPDVQLLFSDAGLHPSPTLKNLVAYCWFAAIYGQSPVGLKALDGKVSAETNRVLQQIAWDAVRAEPLNGLSPTPPSSPKSL